MGRHSNNAGVVREVGYTLLELVFAAGISMVLTGVAVPLGVSAIDRVRAVGAARFVATRLQQARVQALRRSAYAGLRFVRDARGYREALYIDGNGNGLRSGDIARGTDERVTEEERLDDRFAGVRFAILEGVTDIDSGQPLSGDPIQFGQADIVSFSPLGSATSGTMYIAGRGRQQYAIRVLGATGRTRVLRYDFAVARWTWP